MSQDVFARAIKVSPATLRNWEQHRRYPAGPALALLEIVDREPRSRVARDEGEHQPVIFDLSFGYQNA
jgi:putative transcriptional regulator